MLIMVGRALGQRLHRHIDRHQHARQREFTAQLMQLVEVVAQSHLALSAQGILHGVGIDVGSAIPVPTDPLPHTQKTRHRQATQGLLQMRIQTRNFAQERRLVVAEGVFDLVSHRELGKTQQTGLPQLHHPGA